MRLPYPDWKSQLEAYLGFKIPFTANEYIWIMYDAQLLPREAVTLLRELMYYGANIK